MIASLFLGQWRGFYAAGNGIAPELVHWPMSRTGTSAAPPGGQDYNSSLRNF